MIKNLKILKSVQEQLGKGNILKEDILSIKKLDLSKREIDNVSDLAQFKNLESLILTENSITDLSPIAELINLKELRAGNDPFIYEEEKRNRKAKNYFNDFSFLEKLTKLTHVEFTDTDINSIEFVSKLPNLIEFWAYCNPIKDISPLESCQELHKAYFYDCPIKEIDVCIKLPKLCGLAINETLVSDISALEGKNDFVYLDGHGSQIWDILPIKNMKKMNYLTLAGTRVKDISPLLKMQAMKWLTLEVGEYLDFDQVNEILPELKGLNTVALNNCKFTYKEKEDIKNRMPAVNIRFNEFSAL